IRSVPSACDAEGRRPVRRRAVAFLILVWGSTIGLSACSVSYNRIANQTLGDMRRGAYAQALARYDKELTADKDRLLYLLDKGLILHTAGEYQKSNELLLQAEGLAEQIDSVSVSEQAATLVSNETV